MEHLYSKPDLKHPVAVASRLSERKTLEKKIRILLFPEKGKTRILLLFLLSEGSLIIAVLVKDDGSDDMKEGKMETKKRKGSGSSLHSESEPKLT